MVSLLLVSAEMSPDDPMPSRVSVLARTLARSGNRIFVLCNAGRSTEGTYGNLKPKIVSTNSVAWIFPPALYVPSLTGIARLVATLWNILSSILLALIIHESGLLEVDAIYASTAQSQGVIASVLCRIWKVPLIVDYGDPSFVRDTGIVRRLGSLLETVSMERADAVISSDPVISKYVRSKFNRAATFLPNGYDTSLFKPAEVSRHLASSVTFVGKMDISVYRLDLLLLASKLVIDSVPKATVRLIGAGPDLGELKQIAKRLGIHQSVEFMGQIPHSKVPEWISATEICVHATNDTCMGLKVMEYLAAGKPTVIAGSWWNKYHLFLKDGDNCLLVHPDKESLARAIIRLLQNRKLALELGRRGRATVQSWDEVAQQFAGIIQDNLTNSNRSPSN